MEDEEVSLILTQLGEPDFLTLTGEAYFVILIMVEKAGTQVQMSIG